MSEDSVTNASPELPEELAAFVTELFQLARTGGDDVADKFEQYIQAGLNPNLTNHEGNTFLMLAAYSGHASLVSRLASLGADVNKLNDRGQSPLAGAIFKKEPEVVEALLAAGADPLLGHPTAVETAMMFGQQELAQRMTQGTNQ